MTIYDLIDDETRRQLNVKKPVVHRQSHKEKLSQHDLNELMGTNRQTYTKRNGRVRGK